MKISPSVEAFVLAGGLSRRMGQDKALLRIKGQSLLEIALAKLPAARIAAARSDLSSYAAIVPDLHPGCGPLSGIEAALAASAALLNLFLPVDLPLLPGRFLLWMVRRAEVTGALGTIPRIGGRPQPLCAVYHRDLLGPLTASLLAGEYKVMPAVCAAAREQVDIFDVERVGAANPEVRGFSSLPLYQWFHNCNTPDDMVGIEML